MGYTMSKGAKTVLIVEDSPAQALALEHLLKGEGLGVLWASDGQVGVTLAQQHICLLYTSQSPRDRQRSRMPSSA